MITSRLDLEVAPGFAFCPQHKELTDVYLRLKIAGEPLPGAAGRFIHEADVYSAEPEQLVSAFQKAPGTGKGAKQQPVWYFFSPGGRKKNARGGATRRSRTIEGVVGKHWHSEGGAKPVEGGSAVGGYKQLFSYMAKSESGKKKNVRVGWVMYEYGISEEHGGGDLVLCKILPSDRTGQEAPAATTTAAVSTISSKKRKRKDPKDTRASASASARPRRTVDQDQHPLQAESLGAARTTEDADVYGRHACADENLLGATELHNLWPHMEGVEDCYGGDPDTAVSQVQEMGGNMEAQPEVQDMYGAAPSPNNFLHNMVVEEGVDWYGVGGSNYSDGVGGRAAAAAEMDGNLFDNVGGLYQNNIVVVGPGGDLAAQSEVEGDAAGLIQSIAADGNDQHHHRMEEGTQPEPEEPAADEPIYGLPCPDFSPEMIRMCSRMPWPPSPTSMAAILSGL